MAVEWREGFFSFHPGAEDDKSKALSDFILFSAASQFSLLSLLRYHNFGITPTIEAVQRRENICLVRKGRTTIGLKLVSCVQSKVSINPITGLN